MLVTRLPAISGRADRRRHPRRPGKPYPVPRPPGSGGVPCEGRRDPLGPIGPPRLYGLDSGDSRVRPSSPVGRVFPPDPHTVDAVDLRDSGPGRLRDDWLSLRPLHRTRRRHRLARRDESGPRRTSRGGRPQRTCDAASVRRNRPRPPRGGPTHAAGRRRSAAPSPGTRLHPALARSKRKSFLSLG